ARRGLFVGRMDEGFIDYRECSTTGWGNGEFLCEHLREHLFRMKETVECAESQNSTSRGSGISGAYSYLLLDVI
ncbi:MAG: hypothetical protein K8I60_20655, partial [Anaerolineae bacterium]|nr:hypothetical protein [Anaerolineae bacterium]